MDSSYSLIVDSKAKDGKEQSTKELKGKNLSVTMNSDWK